MGALAKYGEALAIDPAAPVSHDWIHKNFSAAKRLEFYAKAAAAHLKRTKPDKKKVATLTWYAAFAHYENKSWKEAEKLFLESVAANPQHVNSYYWAMWAALQDAAMDRAARHCAAYATIAPITFADDIRKIQPEAARNSLIKHLETFAAATYGAGRLDAARDISHVLAAVLDTAQQWNNYAFLCRETKMYKESLAAYENALQVAPEDPQLMNDAAVILDFHLGTTEQIRQAETVHQRLMTTRRMVAYRAAPQDAEALAEQAKRNLRRAAEMYDEAQRLADRALKSSKVPKEDLQRYRTARRDARNNLRKLKTRLK